jgi:outer membrane protein OmpA-like peptidoglycan-associated protein
MRRSLRWLIAVIICSGLSTNAQSLIINEEWAKLDVSDKVFFNESTKQIAVLRKNSSYTHVTYNEPGAWEKPTMTTRISQDLVEDLHAIGIEGDSVVFASEDPGLRQRWLVYNIETGLSREGIKDKPEGAQSIDNFGTICQVDSSSWFWESFRGMKRSLPQVLLLDGVTWKGYSSGKWLFVSQILGSDQKTLNFFDSDGTITPFPYPINREKVIRQAHWINSDSIIVVEYERNELSVRLYALVSEKLIKGDASRLKLGSYSLLYETWEDTIPRVMLEPVNVVGALSERLLPNKSADRQTRKLGGGKFAVRFKAFTDPNQAYSFLSRLVNILPGSYSANIDTGIVILGPRRTTYEEVKADSIHLALNSPEIVPSGIISFADQLKERNETVVTLYARDRVTMNPVSFQLSFFNRTQDQMIFVDSASSGHLSFVYGHGDELGLTLTAKGYAPKSIRINSKTDSLPTLYYQDVLLDQLAPLVRGLDGEMIPEKGTLAIDFQNILFDFNSFALRNVSQPELQAMADLIKRSKSPHVEIVGHTDDIGSNSYNKRLGQLRADAVCKALIQLGVNPNVLKPISKGEQVPLFPNDSDFNRSLNRRVELGKLQGD